MPFHTGPLAPPIAYNRYGVNVLQGQRGPQGVATLPLCTPKSSSWYEGTTPTGSTFPFFPSALPQSNSERGTRLCREKSANGGPDSPTLSPPCSAVPTAARPHLTTRGRLTPREFAAALVAGFSVLRRWRRIASAARAAVAASRSGSKSAKLTASIAFALTAPLFSTPWLRILTAPSRASCADSFDKSGRGATPPRRSPTLPLIRFLLADFLCLSFLAVLLAAAGALAWYLHQPLPAVLYWLSGICTGLAAVFSLGVASEIGDHP